MFKDYYGECGRCGADITAQEKFKKLKNGEFNRHVYYNRTRRIDPSCREEYINEEDLKLLILDFIQRHHETIDINHKLKARIEKHYQVTRALLDHYQLKQNLESPFIEYSRYNNREDDGYIRSSH